MTFPSPGRAALAACAALLLGVLAQAQGRVWTTDADFDEGFSVNVNHDAPNVNQLQLDAPTGGAPFPFVALSATGRGTMLRIDARTGALLGEYRTAPEGLLRSPQRTTVDAEGNVWLGNADEQGGGQGSVVKIGLVLGGTRVLANGTPDANGEYLAPPFVYSTCVDRDGDGLIRTSRGLGDVLAWPNVTDGAGGTNGVVEDALDECILVFQRTTGTRVRHVSVDSSGDMWAGGYPDVPTSFDLLDGRTGAILSTFAAPGCGGHGGLVDNAGVLWSSSLNQNSLMRRVISSGVSTCIPIPTCFGTTLDTQGNVWASEFVLSRLWKIQPDGTVAPGFPVAAAGNDLPRGLAFTPADGQVWSANSGNASVSRRDSAGALVATIPLGTGGTLPTGLSVDIDGKLWVSCRTGNTAKRIDPAANGGLGAVDLTVTLPANTVPDNYGDMTGLGGGAIQAPGGFWNVVHDGGAAGVAWSRVLWNAQVPGGTALAVGARAADDSADLAGLPFVPALNGGALLGVAGRFVELRVDFSRPPASPLTPVLFDIAIEAASAADDCLPGRRRPASLLLFPEFDHRSGVTTLLTVTNTQSSGPSIDVEIVYVGRYGQQGEDLSCLERNRVHPLTPNDTLSLLTRLHAPDFQRGFVYAFARRNGVAVVHEHLIGNMLLLVGPEAVDYSYNPLVYCGIGEPGEPTDRDGDGLRDLDGVEYSLSPAELLVPRFLAQGRGIESELTLVNLTGGASFEAIASFQVYNDNEEPFSAQLQFRCWSKRALPAISNVFTQTFLAGTNQNPAEILGATTQEAGWFRVDGDVAFSSATSLPDPALVGLLIDRARGKAAADLPFERGAQANGDLYPLGPLGDLP